MKNFFMLAILFYTVILMWK